MTFKLSALGRIQVTESHSVFFVETCDIWSALTAFSAPGEGVNSVLVECGVPCVALGVSFLILSKSSFLVFSSAGSVNSREVP